MRISTKILFIPLTTSVLLGCLKNDEFPVIPQIEFSNMTLFGDDISSPDSATFKFTFTDGDGDLGSSDTTVFNCFLDYYEEDGDSMKYFPEFQRQYRLPSLTPNAKNKAIEGEINLTLKPAPIFNPLTDSSYEWRCTIIDRAGNLSNEISSQLLSK